MATTKRKPHTQTPPTTASVTLAFRDPHASIRADLAAVAAWMEREIGGRISLTDALAYAARQTAKACSTTPGAGRAGGAAK